MERAEELVYRIMHRDRAGERGGSLGSERTGSVTIREMEVNGGSDVDLTA